MRIKLTVSTVWTVDPSDEAMAHKLLTEQPQDAILDAILDATYKSLEYSGLETSATVLGD